MSRLSRLLSAACLGAAATAACFAAEHNPTRPVPHASASGESARIIVKLRDRAQVLSLATSHTGDRVRAAGVLGTRLHLALADGRALGPRTQVLMAKGLSSAALAARVAQEADVEWAVVDERRYPTLIPNDPLFPGGQTGTTPIVGQWYLRVPDAADNQGAISAIDAQGAWDITTGTAAVVIADIDTGVTQHPDLLNAFLPNSTGGSWPPYGYDFIAYSNDGTGGIPTANDGDGDDPDPSDPGDWIDSTDQTHSYFDAADCPLSASSWHGTQTAGILSAQINNAVGMAGVAPGAKLVPIRALGKCGGYDSDIIVALEWAAGMSVSGVPANAHPARVVNMSLGSSGTCTAAYRDAFSAVTARNVLIVVSAGNDEGLPVGAPANCPGALAVAALRQAGDKVGFSNIGPEIAISAPGGNCVSTGLNEECKYPILTTMNTGTTGPSSATYTTGFFEPSVGTSFSAPIVAGTAALMMSAAPSLTAATVRSLIQSTATPFPTTGGTDGVNTPVCQAPAASAPQDECYCTTTTCGAGMLNAHAAVAAAAVLASPQALITASASTLVVGGSVSLSGLSSTPASGKTITSYQWTLAAGSSAFASLSASSGPSVTLTGIAAGTATVQLTITDSSGATATTTQAFTVSAPASDDGGGAANPLWLMALGLGALLLAPRRRVARD